jgi:TfoX/Sxy family transcriptional regulator of competence genes
MTGGAVAPLPLVRAGKQVGDETIAALRHSFKADMEAVLNRSLKPNETAHHIVALTDRRAAESRRLMEGFGLGVNDARVNGAVVNMDIHHPMHTNVYHQHVQQGLEHAKNAREAERFLKRVGREASRAKNVEDLSWERAARREAEKEAKRQRRR